MHLFWNHDPQHAKNENINVTVPNAMAKESALNSAYCGNKDVYPSYAILNQIPTPRRPHPETCKEISLNS